MGGYEDNGDDIYFEPDYHPDSKSWSIHLTFPRASKLSDEDMHYYFQGYDGRWSQETKSAIAFHDAKGLDLNDNWALTWRGWSCPGCGRAKNEIFRLSKRDILLAKLELHHDHMTDFIWPRAESLFGKNWRDDAPAGFGDVLDTIERLASRFKTCLLCSECNAADGKVKRKFQEEIDSRFSFTASEISRFIRPRTHQDHEVDFEEALKIWKTVRGGFEARLQLVDQLLNGLEKGHLMREHYGALEVRPMWTLMGPTELLLQAFHKDAAESERARLLSEFRSEFLARSTSRDSATLPTRTAVRASTRPTDDEFDNYIDPVSERRWHETPLNWKCPVCQRSKREILRKSNKGKWAGGIREHRELIDEDDVDVIQKRQLLLPNFRNEYWIKSICTIHICSDCSGIGTQVVQRDRSLGEPYLKLQDLRDSLIECTAHQRHTIDIDFTRQRIAQNDAYRSAEEALRAFEMLIIKFRHKMQKWSEGGIARPEIIADMCQDLKVYYQINNTAEQKVLVSWILKQKEKSTGNG